MNLVPLAGEVTLTTAMSDVTDFITDVLGLVTDNWLLIFLLLAPFAIGLLVSLIHSLRG